MIERPLLGLWTTAAVLALSAGCSSGNGGTGGQGGSGGGTCGAGVDVTGCTTVLEPSGGDDTKKLQTEFINVKSGSTLCLCPGTFNLSDQLSLTERNVTVKGVGKNIDDTVLDFSRLTVGGNDTMQVTADGFTIENLSVRNTPGNGVVVRQADKPTFRKLHVKWDDPDMTKHGAYAVYPAECTNVLVEDCEVEGAADAAIYVGQGTGAILRRNKAHDSVLGIELENTTGGEAYDNEAFNNTGGMAVFLLGDLSKKDADKNLVYDNKIHDNNGVNFGDKATVVSHVPVGTGIIVVAASNTEIRGNTIANNESVGILAVSYEMMVALIMGKDDPSIDPYVEGLYIHDNTFMNNGMSPQDPVTAIGPAPLEDVLWDGWVNPMKTGMNPANICLGPMPPSFRNFDGKSLACVLGGGTGCTVPMASTDTTNYQCAPTQLPGSKP